MVEQRKGQAAKTTTRGTLAPTRMLLNQIVLRAIFMKHGRGVKNRDKSTAKDVYKKSYMYWCYDYQIKVVKSLKELAVLIIS